MGALSEPVERRSPLALLAGRRHQRRGPMPVGFCFAAYFSSIKRWQHPVVAAVFLGFVLSLTIEVLQAFLPTRNSGANGRHYQYRGHGLWNVALLQFVGTASVDCRLRIRGFIPELTSQRRRTRHA
jgi:hypothetical protein